MTQLDDRIRRAFAEVHAPEAAKASALAAIEERRRSGALVDGDARARRGEGVPEGAVPLGRSDAPRRPSRRRIRWLAAPLALAAALALAFIGVGAFHGGSLDEPVPDAPSAPAGASVTAQPSAFVGIDVNPSLELAVSASGEVLEARSLNEDAEGLLSQVSLVGAKYPEALAQLLGSEAFAPYRMEDALIEVDVVSSDDGLASQLLAESDAALAEWPGASTCLRADEADRQAAAAAGMGMGRYRVACELAELDPSVTIEDCAHMSMRELRDRLGACTGEGNGKPSGEAASGGQGAGYRAGAGGHHGGGYGRHHG